MLALPDSQHLKMVAGLRGRITRWLVLNATAGYGSGVYDEESVSADADSGCDGLALELDATANGFDSDAVGLDGLLLTLGATVDTEVGFGQLRVGATYRKDFVDSYFTNYNAFNQVAAFIEADFGRSLTGGVRTSIRFEDYHGEIERNDILLRLGTEWGVHFTQWATLSATAFWTERASNHADVQYDDVEFALLGTFTY